MAVSSLAETTRKLKASLEDRNKVTQSEQTVVVHEVAPVDLSKNVFAINMARDNDVTEEEKGKLVREKISFEFADPVAAKIEDVSTYDQILNEFEQYYSNLQDSSINVDQESIKELMDRIENAIAPEMRKMLESLISTNGNIKECSNLLSVLKIARDAGKTIEELTNALRLQEQTKRDIKNKESDISNLEARLVTSNQAVEIAKKRVDEAPRGFLGWGGVPEHLSVALSNEQKRQQDITLKLKTAQEEIESLKIKLDDTDTLLNDPRLQILRSFDLTHNGLKEKIHTSAQTSIDTINSIRNSIKSLIVRVNASESAVAQIINEIENARIDRTVLISSFSEAYNSNREIIEICGKRIEELQKNLDKIDPDTVEAGRIRVELMRLTTTHRAMLSYNSRVDSLLKIMQKTDANSVVASNDAERTIQSVRNNREGFNTISNETLPSVSRAMRLVLHQFADEQDQEFRMAIGQVTSQLGETAKGTAERALEQQAEYHKQKIKALEETINGLNSASDLLSRSLEIAVNSSVEEEQAYKKVASAANELRDGMSAATEIKAQIKERVRKSGDDATIALGIQETNEQGV